MRSALWKIKLPGLAIAPLFAVVLFALPRQGHQLNADGWCQIWQYTRYQAPNCLLSNSDTYVRYNDTSYGNYYAGNYQPVGPSGRIYQTGQITRNQDDDCLYTGYVQWDTANIKYAEVTVNDPDTGQEKLFAAGPYGSSPAPWLQPGKTYVFNLLNRDYGRTRIDSTQLNLQGLSCAPNVPPPSPAPPTSPNTTPPVSGTAQAVGMGDNYFFPRTLAVPAGTAVVWNNNGATAHTVTADNGMFDSGALSPGDNYRLTFTSPGTYSYHCRFHPGMTGTIVVTDNNQPSTAPYSNTAAYTTTQQTYANYYGYSYPSATYSNPADSTPFPPVHRTACSWNDTLPQPSDCAASQTGYPNSNVGYPSSSYPPPATTRDYQAYYNSVPMGAAGAVTDP